MDAKEAQVNAELTRLRRKIAELEAAADEHAEEIAALKTSEALHRVILESIMDPVFVTDDDGRFVFICANVERILGYTVEEIQAMGHIGVLLGGDLFEPEILDTTGEIHNVECLIEDKRGQRRVLLIDVRRVSIAGGTRLYNCRDVSEHYQAIDALNASRRELRITLDATTDGIWTWDFRTGELFFSPRYYTMLGYEPGDFPATFESWRDLIHPDDRDAAIAVANRWLEEKGGQYENEFRLRTKSGGYRCIKTHGRVVEWDEQGQAVRMIGNHRDVTARKESEAALRESEHRFREMAEAFQDVFWMTEPASSKMLYVSPAYEAVWQRPIEDLYDDPRVWIASIHPDDVGVISVNWEKQMQGIPTRDEFRIIRLDGSVRWIENRAYPIVDDNGQVQRVTGVAKDITEWKAADQRLRAALAEKEALLRELYHRTKNNMQVICSMLMLQAARLEDERTIRAFKAMEDRIRSMALVHQMLYDSNNLSNIDLSLYIRDLVPLLMQSYSVELDTVSLHLDLESAPVMIDTAIPCGLVLNELVSNALEHAFPDQMSGEIAIYLRETADREITLRVSDNGIGVPPDFSPRTNDTLGMKMIHALAEQQLRGRVLFDTQDGVACTITFYDTLYDARI